ncbi:hypothetical protein QBC35DRAFT_448228 [Podospora australis]|uniref:Uncharacterized protein n=1 Tax=Podospora australis TaxID=1536484 RepID=A0AAN6X0N2_9PEZI|nr:hypothetical protein QBC35DRAFT_448228 [Podospora australis]
MDLDIEMDVDDVQVIPQIPEAYTQDIITGEEQEPGEVDETFDDHNTKPEDNELVLNKVNIRGLDTFKPDDVKSYLKEHSADANFERIEWVDDTSANFIYRSESAARDALIALAAVGIADPTQLAPRETIPARTFAQKPESFLQVRYAVASDKKAAGASQYSRFYLLNPEYDPEERRRRGEFSRGKYRDREDRPRRRNDRRREQRSEEPETFDENFYDEKSTTSSTRPSQRSPRPRRRSSSRDSRDRSRDNRNRTKELFPDRRGSGRLRDRSASPIRDRDGDAQMDLDEDARASAALRSREKGRSLREQLSRDTRSKELFPEKANGTKKELFPTKVSSTGSRAQMDQVTTDATVLSSAKLADRITTKPTATTSSAGGISIRGMANRKGSDQGISIKGMGGPPTVKELFPEKFGNSGKELFAEKIAGRGQRRQRAADSFY